jgi:molybdenum cofactor cytidylyltransferase
MTTPVASPPLRPTRLGAVLMAAGAGARMGHRAKSLLELDGVPLIRRQLAALQQAGATQVVVVLGHHAKDIAPHLAGLDVTLVLHPDPDAGQVSSQRLGLQALSEPCDAVLMALADQPLIDAQDLTQLIDAFAMRPEGCALLFPRVQGQPGNPVIFTAEVGRQVLASPDATGCKQWRQQHPQQVQAWDCDNRHFVLDVDTPQDIENLRQTTGHQLHWPSPAPVRPSP